MRELLPKQQDLCFSKLTRFQHKLFFLTQSRLDKRLCVYDVENAVIMTQTLLKKRIIHAEFSQIRSAQVLLVSFEDNSLRHFVVLSKPLGSQRNLLDLIQSKSGRVTNKENLTLENCTPCAL